MPDYWKRESLETVKEQLICHGGEIRQKIDKIWTIRLNKNYYYKQEVMHIYRSIKKRVHFNHYVKIFSNDKPL